ncbi:hypothetical protein [Vibrio sp. D431a]|uniref:hypothetical protein n=1 Tax=Vibrio sp. D431a TaxID=2837388 RepID=UPI0025525F98|nr:hypothetical protein [Vibrio sp. D431a]MDK9790678.1 hypothetical protein [Vibrio sp. D431a]
MNKQLSLFTLLLSVSASSLASENTQNTPKEIDITPEFLSVEIATIDSTDLSSQLQQEDGSQTHLLKADTMLGLRSDQSFAYVTPISKRVAGIESFTIIQPHHCIPFLDVLRTNASKYGLIIVENDQGIENTLAARNKDGSTVMFAECSMASQESQFQTVMYHMPTQHMLSLENNKIVTSSSFRSGTKPNTAN